MNVSIKVKNRSDRDGKQLLLIVITGANKRTTISTGIKIDPYNWVKGTIHKREENSDLKKTLLMAKLSLLNQIISEAQINNLQLNPLHIKDEFIFRISRKSRINQVSNKHKLINSTETYREKYKNIRKASTLRSWDQFINHIRQYDSDIYLEDINHDWIIGYCNYLIEQGLEDSTIKYRHLKCLKIIASEGNKIGIKINPAIEQFTWKSVSKQPFFASWEEVKQIESLSNLISSNRRIAKDLFILACYTGLRESDLTKLSKENVHYQAGEMMMRIIVTKTDFDYSIPVNETVKSILKKYEFSIPKISQQEFNRQIKLVARAAKISEITKTVKSSGNKRTILEQPKWKLFTSHTGRRTFGRRFLDRGGSLIVLSKLFGHKNTETTLHYIGYQPSEIVSEFKKVFD